MANLKDETLKELQDHGKTWADVRWVGHSGGAVKFNLDYFLEVANKEYDDGYGGAEVCESLVVVGDDWWLERHEYDGSEWWEFKTLPILKDDAKFAKDPFDSDLQIMSNLEYLEWEQSRRV